MIPLLTWEWPETPIVLTITVVLALVLRFLIVRAIHATVEGSIKRAETRASGWGSRAERILGAVSGVSDARHAARMRTLGSVLRSITSVVILSVVVMMVMNVLGLPLAPILTTAGVGGVALGFGAQSLVKDYLSGIFLIIEDQFGVGDLVDTGDVKGTVEDVGLRVTRLRDMTGQIWYVRNGEILRVGNQSQGWSTANVSVPVAADEDAAKVISLLEGVMDEVFSDERWENVLLEKPKVAGVDTVSGGTMTIKVFAKCAPNEQWGVQRDILERAQAALQRAEIRGPIIPLAGS